MIKINPKVEFKKLKLLNFGPFYQEKNIEFSIDHKKNITLFKGEQGTGKTTIFQLIWWLLFPKIKASEKEQELSFLRSHFIKDAVNTIAINNEKTGNEIKVGGSIEFTKFDRSGNPTNYSISRYIYFIKEANGIKYKQNSIEKAEELFVYKDSQAVIDPYNVLKNVINDFFPEAVRDFVFIFGEGLTRILSIENVGKVKDDALDISDYPRIKGLLTYLEACEDYYRGRRKKANEDVEKLQKIQVDIDKLEQNKKDNQEEIDKTEKELEKLRNNITDYRNEMNKVKGNIEFIKEFNENISKIKELKDTKRIVVENRETILMEYGPIIYLENAMKRILNDIKNKRDKGIIPGKITGDALKLILEREKDCICGTKWTEELKVNINKLIASSPQSKIGETAVKFETKLENTLNQVKSGKQRILESEKKLITLNTKIQELESKQNVLKLNLSDEEREEDWYQKVIDLEAKISEGDQLIGEYSGNIKKFKTEKSDIEEKLGDRETTYRKEEKKISKTPKATNYSKFINDLEILKEIINDLEKIASDRIRITTEKETLLALKKLAKDPQNWEKVIIDDKKTGWIIRAINKNESSITNISTGQTNVVGFSFIYALSSILGIDLPMIIDSPFINIDLKTREQVGHNLPKIYEGRQLIFFMKESEFTGPKKSGSEYNIDLYSILNQFIGQEYIIENKTNDNANIIRR